MLDPMTLRMQRSLVTLANSVELTASVVKELAGSEIASTLAGDSLTNDALRVLILSRLNERIDHLPVKE